MSFIMSIIRKEQSMIKKQINKREAFAEAGSKRIARSKCSLGTVVRGGLVLDSYKLIASGKCSYQKIGPLNNITLFANQQKQKEVA